MTYNGQHLSAHRAAWIANHGDIPEGLHVCHKCDVRACINPDHLFLGTHADNMADRNAKGRHGAGPTHPMTKITPQTAAAIFMAPGTQRAIAKQFGTHQSTVWQIKSGAHWTSFSPEGRAAIEALHSKDQTP